MICSWPGISHSRMSCTHALQVPPVTPGTPAETQDLSDRSQRVIKFLRDASPRSLRTPSTNKLPAVSLTDLGWASQTQIQPIRHVDGGDSDVDSSPSPGNVTSAV